MKIKTSLIYRRHSLPQTIQKTWYVSVLLSLALSNNYAHGQTAPEQLIEAAHTFLQQVVPEHLAGAQIQGRFTIEINRLDPRLRLSQCDQMLETNLESPAQPIGRVTVRVRCNGISPWTVFVPGQVRLYRDVLVANRPIARNTTLGPSDFKIAERDVGLLTQPYLTEPSQALGLRSSRPLQPDQILLANQLELEDVVQKGDQVVISAQTSSVHVRMPGEAMSSGALGEQINVRNLRSQRVIRARITGPGQVSVSL